MNLLYFVDQYPNEGSCRIRWKKFRDAQRVVCPKCGHGYYTSHPEIFNRLVITYFSQKN